MLILGKMEGRRGRKRIRGLDGITESMDMSLSKLRETMNDREASLPRSMGRKESDMTEPLNNKKINVLLKGSLLFCVYFGLFVQLRHLCMWACSAASDLSNSLRRFVAHQAPLREDTVQGKSFTCPGDLPNPGIEPMSLASLALQVDSLPTEPPSLFS